MQMRAINANGSIPFAEDHHKIYKISLYLSRSILILKYIENLVLKVISYWVVSFFITCQLICNCVCEWQSDRKKRDRLASYTVRNVPLIGTLWIYIYLIKWYDK